LAIISFLVIAGALIAPIAAPIPIAFAIYNAIHEPGVHTPGWVGIILIGSFIATLLAFGGIGITIYNGLQKSFRYPGIGSNKASQIAQSVCTQLKMRPFRLVHVDENINAHTGTFGGSRFLVIGVPLLSYLSTPELEAVIAHECGHHHRVSFLPNRVTERAGAFLTGLQRAVDFSIAKTTPDSKGSSIAKSTPDAFGAMRDTAGIFVVVAQSLSFFIAASIIDCLDWIVSKTFNDPENEIYCDSVAINLRGGEIFATGLKKIASLKIADAYLEYLANADPNASRKGSVEYLEDLMVMADLHLQRESWKNHPEINGPTKSHPALGRRLNHAQNATNTSAPSVVSLHQFSIEDCKVLWRELHRGTDIQILN
jgi:Zn-dependent protease with chaperone function